MNDDIEMRNKHVEYMTQKWGKFYTDSKEQRHSVLLSRKERSKES